MEERHYYEVYIPNNNIFTKKYEDWLNKKEIEFDYVILETETVYSCLMDITEAEAAAIELEKIRGKRPEDPQNPWKIFRI